MFSPKDVFGVALLRSLYLSVRFRGRIVLVRGTRLRRARGARIEVTRGCRLLIGGGHIGGAAASVDLMRNAVLTAHGRGRVTIHRGTRILVLAGARLEVGAETTIGHNSVVTCAESITIAPSCAVSWNVNIIDGNLHELIVDGVPRPRTRPVILGRDAWIGTGATIVGAQIGAGAIVGAGSVVVADVPEKVAVAGNPARIIRKNVSWRV